MYKEMVHLQVPLVYMQADPFNSVHSIYIAALSLGAGIL